MFCSDCLKKYEGILATVCPICSNKSDSPVTTGVLLGIFPTKESFSGSLQDESKLSDCSSLFDNCSDNGLAIFCKRCELYLCQGCEELLYTPEANQNHTRPSHPKKIFHPPHCSTHIDFTLDMFCNTCQFPICVSCHQFGSHVSHEAKLVFDKAKPLRQRIETQMHESHSQAQKAEASLLKLEGLMVSIRMLESELNANSSVAACTVSTAKGAINSHFDQIIKTAEDARRDLLSQVDRAADSKFQDLQQQAIQLTSNLRAFQQSHEEAKNLLELSDYEICTSGCKDKLLDFPSWVVFEPSVDISIPSFFNTSAVMKAINGSRVGVPSPPEIFIEPRKNSFKLVWQVPDMLPEQPALKCYKLKVFVCAKDVSCLTSKEANAIYKTETPAKIFEVLENPNPSISVTDTCFDGQTITAAVMAIDVNGCCSDWSWSSAVKLRKYEQFVEHIIPFKHAEQFCGVLYYIGTAGGSRAYVNPCESGDVVVEWSSICNGKVANFAQHTYSGKWACTKNEPNSWMMLDLGARRSLFLTAYSLRHGYKNNTVCLRNWELQGRKPAVDGAEGGWVVLKAHVNDVSLTQGDCSVSWELNLGQQAFRYFRIKSTGPDSSGNNFVMCCGIELFGTIIETFSEA